MFTARYGLSILTTVDVSLLTQPRRVYFIKMDPVALKSKRLHINTYVIEIGGTQNVTSSSYSEMLHHPLSTTVICSLSIVGTQHLEMSVRRGKHRVALDCGSESVAAWFATHTASFIPYSTNKPEMDLVLSVAQQYSFCPQTKMPPTIPFYSCFFYYSATSCIFLSIRNG